MSDYYEHKDSAEKGWNDCFKPKEENHESLEEGILDNYFTRSLTKSGRRTNAVNKTQKDLKKNEKKLRKASSTLDALGASGEELNQTMGNLKNQNTAENQILKKLEIKVKQQLEKSLQTIHQFYLTQSQKGDGSGVVETSAMSHIISNKLVDKHIETMLLNIKSDIQTSIAERTPPPQPQPQQQTRQGDIQREPETPQLNPLKPRQ